jgi:signal transduction histidine kinase
MHVPHEIKNPMNVINMQAETLAEFGAESEELRVTAINVIQDEVERVSRLIGDLLNITQIEGGSLAVQRVPVKLRDLLEDAFVTTMRAGEARNIVPQLDLPRHLPTILANKDLLRLAFNNFLTNAVKYNRDGGTVTLKAVENDDAVVIEISDEGVGISVDDQLRVFENLFRSDDPAARARRSRSRAGFGEAGD